MKEFVFCINIRWISILTVYCSLIYHVNKETYLNLEGLEPTVENLSASMQTNIGILEYFLVLNCQQPWLVLIKPTRCTNFSYLFLG
jgi:hypothetical protein